MLDKNIIKFIDKNLGQRKILIETGFKNGDSLRYFLNYNFDKYYTIEFHQKYFTNQIGFLKMNADRVFPITGDSAVELDKLLNELDNESPACIYLDAHGHDSNISPLISELKALKKHNRKDDLIIIDDAFFIENAQNDKKRSPWAREIIDSGYKMIDIYNLLREINGEDAIIEKIPYYGGPLYRTIFKKFNPYTEQGKNYHLVSRSKNI